MNLKHPIEFLQNIKESPLHKDNWQVAYQVFACISNLHPDQIGMVENFDFGHIITANFVSITIRHNNLINAKMRIRFKSREFEIKKMVEDFDNQKFLKIIALEIK